MKARNMEYMANKYLRNVWQLLQPRDDCAVKCCFSLVRILQTKCWALNKSIL